VGIQTSSAFVADAARTASVTVVGQYRLPSDVVTELLAVLAEEPGTVVCDLAGLAPTPASLGEVFAPVVHYLSQWSGAVVVVRLPRNAAGVFHGRLPGNLLVHRAGGDDPLEHSAPGPPLEHSRTCMLPAATTAADARVETRRILAGWGMSRLAEVASVVVSELVTRSFLHAHGLLDLNLSRMGTQLRAAVGDSGSGLPAAPVAGGPGILDERAWLVLQASTRAWGVLPTLNGGKQVWAVLDQRPGAGPYDGRPPEHAIRSPG
jgi:hypothetical protein